MTERWILANGLIVLYRRDSDMPLAAGTLLLRSGTRHEKSAEAGLCNFTFEMLLSGTRKKNAREIADVIETVGGSLGAQATEDYSEVDWLVPAIHAERVIQLMAEILMEPRWPAEELEKQRRHILTDLHTRSDVLFNVAYDAFRKNLFKQHAYARPVDGTEETVKAFTKQDVARWHRTYLQPEQAIFSLAGPWPTAQAKRLVEKGLAAWGHKNKPAGPLLSGVRVNASLFSEPVIVQATFQQAYFMTGTYAPSLLSGNILPLKLWNMILGGGMSSRLFVQLREERGLAYEVSSFYPARLDSGAWAIYMGLPAERLPEAERTLQKLLQELLRQGPTLQELKQAKQLLQGTYVMDHQTRRRQAWYAAWWEFLGRAPNYDRHYLKRIASISMAEVRAAGRALLGQSQLTVKVIPK